MIHKVMGLPMLSKEKTTKNLGQAKLAKKTHVEWDGRGMKLNSVIDMEIKFWIHVIPIKFAFQEN